MTNKHRILIVLLILIVAAVWALFERHSVRLSYNQSHAAGTLPVVPGAPLGPGMNTRAAYGCGVDPVILKVTNLSDAVPGPAGSLRAALTDSRPRVVVFEVSGYIVLQDWIAIEYPCLTVAGQTAPNPGITIRGGGTDASIEIHTHDVLLQHLRIRGGDDYCSSGPATWFTGTPTTGIVFDHISESWNFDEGFGIGGGASSSAMAGVTIWRSIAAEGLYTGGDICSQGAGYYSHGILIYHHVNSLVSQSVLAENVMRNPYVSGAGSNLAFLNNVVSSFYPTMFYANSQLSGQVSSEPWHVTFAGNVMIAGPESCCDYWSSTLGLFNYDDSFGTSPGDQIYRNDNKLVNTPGFSVTEEFNELPYDPNVGSIPASAPIPSNYTLMPSSATESAVLANAGARPVDRDAVDQQIISRVQNRQGDLYVETIAQFGGWPNLAQNTRTFNIPANPHTVTQSGYTNLELTLHAAANVVEGTSGNPPPPPPVPPPPPPPSGPVAWWKFDGNLTDSSGNGITGTSTGGPGYVSGHSGQGVSLDGIDDYVNFGSPTNLNIQGALSMSMWVNPSIPTSGEALIMNGSFNYGVTYYSDGQVWFYIGGSGGNSLSTSVSANAWHHVVATWDGTTNANGMKLYVDGTLRVQRASVIGSTSAFGPFYLGRSGSDYFKGTVDDVRIFAKALSAAEVTAIYNESAVTPLVGDINLDHIVNSLDWSLMNARWFTSDASADLNKDGIVNAIDFSLLNANWFKTW